MDQQEALEYLRRLDKVVVPELFTYWTHSSQFKTGETDTKRRGVWECLPTDQFEIKREMSFMSFTNRMQYAAEHGLANAPTSYSPDNSENLEGFQIKVVIPNFTRIENNPSSLGKDNAYLKNLASQVRGLGDGRHPKLPDKTKIHIFAFMDHDEMSGKAIKTVVGVRDEDLVCYAEEVKRVNEETKQRGIILEDVKYVQPTIHNYYEYESRIKKTDILGKNKYSELGKNNFNGNKRSVKEMITKEKIIEQYIEMVQDEDPGLSYKEASSLAKEKYLKGEVQARDFDEYTAPNIYINLQKDSLDGINPLAFAGTSKSFLRTCASGLHRTCGEDLPRKDLDDFLAKSIEAGVNLEGVKKQAYMRLEMMSKSGLEYNPDDIAALRATVAYCNENDSLSPYYELKDNQKMIRYYQEQMAKNPEKAEEYRKKIQERENANIDFLENCDKQGIDRELAEEYLKDCKANLQREANQKKQNSMNIEDSQQKKTENQSGNHTEEERARTVKTESFNMNWSKPAIKEEQKSDPEADGTKARFESQRQAQSENHEAQVEEEKVRPVTKEEIDTTIKENSEFDYMRQQQQQYREQLRREAEERERQKQESTYTDEYGVVRQRVNEEMQQAQHQGMSRGR